MVVLRCKAQLIRFLFFLLAFSSLYAQDGPFLKLEGFLEAPTPWYTGQEGIFVYRISFRGNIQLTKEDLPLLDLSGFQKLGDVTIQTTPSGDYVVQEIRQRVRALKPGTFEVPPSILEAASLKASVPPLYVKVTNIPDKDRPASFNGSIGKFQFEDPNTNPLEITIGNWYGLKVAASQRIGDFLLPPKVDEEVGFAGFFDVRSELVADNMNDGRSTFHFEISPRTTVLQEIPSLEWSWFDPDEKKFHTWKSKKFEVKVLGDEPIENPLVSKLKIDWQMPQAQGMIEPLIGSEFSEINQALTAGNNADLWILKESSWNEAIKALIPLRESGLDKEKANVYLQLQSFGWAAGFLYLNELSRDELVLIKAQALRVAPHDTANYIGSPLPVGTVIEVTEVVGDWLRVRSQKQEGFLRKSALLSKNR